MNIFNSFITRDFIINVKIVTIFFSIVTIYGINLIFIRRKIRLANIAAINESDYDKAISIYKRLIKNEWMSSNYYLLILQVYILQGKFNEFNSFVHTMPLKKLRLNKIGIPIVLSRTIMSFLFNDDRYDEYNSHIQTCNVLLNQNNQYRNQLSLIEAIGLIKKEEFKDSEILLNKIKKETKSGHLTVFICSYLLAKIYNKLGMIEQRNEQIKDAQLCSVSFSYLHLLSEFEEA